VLERFDSIQPGASRAPAPRVTLDAGTVVLVVGITARIDSETAVEADAGVKAARHTASGVAGNGIPIVKAPSAATAS
ncbi:MAG: hypothetical protein ACRYHA_21345, partial [Janthinobacterium lividum]